MSCPLLHSIYHEYHILVTVVSKPAGPGTRENCYPTQFCCAGKYYQAPGSASKPAINCFDYWKVTEQPLTLNLFFSLMVTFVHSTLSLYFLLKFFYVPLFRIFEVLDFLFKKDLNKPDLKPSLVLHFTYWSKGWEGLVRMGTHINVILPWNQGAGQFFQLLSNLI